MSGILVCTVRVAGTLAEFLQSLKGCSCGLVLHFHEAFERQRGQIEAAEGKISRLLVHTMGQAPSLQHNLSAFVATNLKMRYPGDAT